MTGFAGCAMLVAVAMAIGSSACKNPVTATVPLNEQFTVAPKAPVAVGNDGLGVEFLAVTGDSRCPVDVVCIQGGDAVAHVLLEDGRGKANLELHSSDPSRASGTYRDYTITLVDLQPFPFSGRTIPQPEYRATLKVQRR